MDEPQTIHKTCVRVNSAEDDESRDEVNNELPKKNPFVRVSVLTFSKNKSNVFLTPPVSLINFVTGSKAVE